AGMPWHGEHDLLVSKVAELRRQLDILDQQIQTQQSRLALSRDAVNTYKGLLAKRYVSSEQLQQKQEDLLDQQARLQALQREQVALTHELGTQYVIVTATQAGIATALTADVGQAVDGQKPLLSIVPSGSQLHAELLAPSRAVGFVHPGDRVLLRYQAYPYQKFGHYGGMVSSVSKTAIPPEELAASGRSAQGAEPLYQIRVQLDAQSVQAYGKVQPLRSGMTLEADLLQERRHLYEWILDPLYSVSGRI
ncbi:MAG: HlyD family efflux transporter periplasmic adaptor subunit, partial [Nevskia sp.]|nr:HlyD family efflux transporter periplasmic adaptor subunit [Nevskia sp.]